MHAGQQGNGQLHALRFLPTMMSSCMMSLAWGPKYDLQQEDRAWQAAGLSATGCGLPGPSAMLRSCCHMPSTASL